MENRITNEPRVKCDGNHGGPPCADRECWAREDAQPVGADTLTDAEIDALIFEHSGTGLNRQVWFQRSEVKAIVRALANRAIPAEQVGDLERAAVICDQLSALYTRKDVAFDVGYSMGTSRAAREIRALTPAAHPQGAADRSAAAHTALVSVMDTDAYVAERVRAEQDQQRGAIAYQLTKRLVIDMPTARAAVDAAMGTPAAAEPGKGEAA